MIKYSSKKKFAGSKDSSYYDKDYFLNAMGSMYGKQDGKGGYVFYPYTEEYQLNRDKDFYDIYLNILKPKTAIVLGCARGYGVRILRDAGVDAIGVDISEYAIENCDEKIKDYVYCGDICDLSMFKDKSFDILFAVDVLEHIKVPDLYKAIDECVRLSDLVYIGLPRNKRQ